MENVGICFHKMGGQFISDVPRKLKEVSAVKDVRKSIEQIQRTETKAPATEGSGVTLSSKLFQVFHASY